MSGLLDLVWDAEENTSGCAYLSLCQQFDLCFLLMDWLLLGVKCLKLPYHNQQKNYKAVRIPECPFHTLGLNIRDGLIYTKLVLSPVYSGR